MLSIERKPIRISRISYSSLAGIFLLFPLELLGAEPAVAPTQPSQRFETIDAPRDYLSGQFVKIVSDIDRFFGDDRNFQETNNSVIQLDLTKVSGYTGDPKYVFSGRAKINLPSAEKRMHLLIESNPDKNVTGETTQSQTVIREQVVAPESYAAGLRFEKSREAVWHFSTDAGIQFRGITATPFTRARVSYAFPLDEWRPKLAQSAFWFNTIGVGETTQLDVERSMGESYLFRSTSIATWLYDNKNFDLRQDFALYHTLSERTALLYQTSVIGVSQPSSRVTDYVALMSYRYRLHRKWIFVEFSPQIHFPIEKNYKYNPMFLMRLEMLLDRSD